MKSPRAVQPPLLGMPHQRLACPQPDAPRASLLEHGARTGDPECRSPCSPWLPLILLPLLSSAAAQAKLLEHNVRFGDPECQSLMVRLRSDLLATLRAQV